MRDMCTISSDREYVISSYDAASKKNKTQFNHGVDTATKEYIFPNQMEDALNIVDKFYKDGKRVIAIQKKTKVGADGLMIEILKQMSTHPDDSFITDYKNTRIITGMSNIDWQTDMKDKAPECFRGNIFHHGQLKKAELKDMKNGIIIIDEIDTGDKEGNILQGQLKDAGVLDIKKLEENNMRFVFISATMVRELHELYRWGDLYETYKMIIPDAYISHYDFLERGIIQEFYEVKTFEDAQNWITEDIISNYGKEYRVHIIRTNKGNMEHVRDACISNGIIFKDHTATDKLSDINKKEFFNDALSHHVVIAVKGLLRRANLIPNSWKLRIGAVHEMYSQKPDYNVQIQGLPGRMTGYWKDIIDSGHKTGPYRTSVSAVEEYEKYFEDPFGEYFYQSAGFRKSLNGRVKANPTMLHPKNIAGITDEEENDVPDQRSESVIILDGLSDEERGYIRSGCKKIFKIVPELSKYINYKFSLWNADTETKVNKWGLKNINRGDKTGTVNLTPADMKRNFIRFYKIDNVYIVTPWSGETGA